jgi:hypothetical protein
MNNNLPKLIKTNERYSHKPIVDRLIVCMLYEYETTKSWLVTLHGWLPIIELNVCNTKYIVKFGSQVNLNQFTTSFHFVCSKNSHMKIPLWICFTWSVFKLIYDMWWFFNSSFCSHWDILPNFTSCLVILNLFDFHHLFLEQITIILGLQFEIQLITSSFIW